MPSGFRVCFLKRSGGPPFGFSQVLEQEDSCENRMFGRPLAENGDNMKFDSYCDVIVWDVPLFVNPFTAFRSAVKSYFGQRPAGLLDRFVCN